MARQLTKSLAAVLFPALLLAQPGELDFLANHTDYRDFRTRWSDKIREDALRMLRTRAEVVRALQSPADVNARRSAFRQKLTAALGGFPEKTPLNARTTGILDRPDYRVEKVIFESQPRFYVTANLYIPKNGTAPHPAILFPLGHETPGAKAYPVWQQFLITMVKRGYVCLAWDTLGQGERIQLYDEDFETSKVIRSTTEHTILGTQTLLTGDALARYTIWDGIRALDYLVSRKEVDPKRIGLTGNSGGGTHTAYLGAMDDRFAAAAPSCYITSWSRLLTTIGPQDAEQCIPPSIAEGLDHGDFILAFAPKPYMMLSAVRDFFSISGARETQEEARGVYRLLDAEANIGMTEADDGHGYSKPRRLAAYRFFGKWLKGAEDEGEPDIEVNLEEDLRATPTGQVATSLGGETVHTLNRKRADQFTGRRGKVTAEDVRRIIAFQQEPGEPRLRNFGRLTRDGYTIEKGTIESEPGVEIPALLYLPAQRDSGGRAAIFVHGQGKAAAHSDVESLVKTGMPVLSIDLRGMGESQAPNARNGSDWPRYFGNYEAAMTALLSGKTLTAMRALDIIRAVDIAVPHAKEVIAFAHGAAGIPLLHAAVLDPRIQTVAIEGSLVSYRSAVDQRINRGVFEHVIRGVLRHYDLPDLMALIAPRPVSIAGAVDAMGEPLPWPEMQRQLGQAGGNVKLLRRQPGDTTARLFGLAQ
jgi:cephalosporin-C deacetylase-like acetyl esterase